MSINTARIIHACFCVNAWSLMLIIFMPLIVKDTSLFQILGTYPFVIAFALFISGLKNKEELQEKIKAKWKSEGLIND